MFMVIDFIISLQLLAFLGLIFFLSFYGLASTNSTSGTLLTLCDLIHVCIIPFAVALCIPEVVELMNQKLCPSLRIIGNESTYVNLLDL